MSSGGLLESFLAAFQASLSVILIIFYGVLASQFNLLDKSAGKAISKVCVRMFLPACASDHQGRLRASSGHGNEIPSDSK
jgi:hypothetical protein